MDGKYRMAFAIDTKQAEGHCTNLDLSPLARLAATFDLAMRSFLVDCACQHEAGVLQVQAGFITLNLGRHASSAPLLLLRRQLSSACGGSYHKDVQKATNGTREICSKPNEVETPGKIYRVGDGTAIPCCKQPWLMLAKALVVVGLRLVAHGVQRTMPWCYERLRAVAAPLPL